MEAVQATQEQGGCQGAEGLPHQRVDQSGHGRLPLPCQLPCSSPSISSQSECVGLVRCWVKCLPFATACLKQSLLSFINFTHLFLFLCYFLCIFLNKLNTTLASFLLPIHPIKSRQL